MESVVFLKAQVNFLQQLIHSLKIISDNESNRIDFNNDQQIYKLIEKELKILINLKMKYKNLGGTL